MARFSWEVLQYQGQEKLVLRLHTVELSSLITLELRMQISTSKIPCLCFCCKYRATTMETKALLLTQHCNKNLVPRERKTINNHYLRPFFSTFK